MNKYKNLILFFIILAIWSSFFSLIKYFLWWDLKSSINPDLQTISWYLSLWTIFAYIIGWAISASFPKWKLLWIISILTLILVFISNYLGVDNNMLLWISLSWIGFLYWLWTTVKNILIPIEIKNTGLSDIIINAYVWIIFVVFIIIWAILGSLISETIWHNWFYIHIVILFISIILSFQLKYEEDDKYEWKKIKDEIKLATKEYVPEIKYIIKKYHKILIASWLLWAVSTIISQVVIEYSVNHFNKTNSEAWYLLLFSAIWAIIWNIVSMKMGQFRWKAIVYINLLFALIIFLFPLIVSISYLAIIIWAFIVWILFWIVSNLIDSYYLNWIGLDNKKEYGSSTYWLVLSIIISMLMFLSSFINKLLGFTILMFVLWFLILSISWIFINKIKKWS